MQRRRLRRRDGREPCLPHHADGDGGADVLHLRRRLRRSAGELHPDRPAAGAHDDDHATADDHDDHDDDDAADHDDNHAADDNDPHDLDDDEHHVDDDHAAAVDHDDHHA